MKSMTIGILGIPVSSRNQGVRALAASLVKLCADSGRGVEVRLFAANAHPGRVRFHAVTGLPEVPLVNFRLSPASRPCEHLAWILLMSLAYRILPFPSARAAIAAATPWIAALESCDLAGDVRGGDSFSDIYGMRRFATGFLTACTVLLVKGTMVQFPQTYGPFKSRLSRLMARFLLRRSQVIVARDAVSCGIAQDLAGPSKEVRLCPDVAFSLAAARPVSGTRRGGAAEHVIGVNVNGLMYHGGYTRGNMFGLRMDYPRFLEELLVALLDKQAGGIRLVPHTYAGPGDVESDSEASLDLIGRLAEPYRARVELVDGEHDAHELKGWIGSCGFFIGSRMHSCIAALSQGVPCVGVAYSMKFRGVFETVGMEDWVVDGRELDGREALRRVMRMYRLRDLVRDRLAADAEAARMRLKMEFESILKPVVKERVRGCGNR